MDWPVCFSIIQVSGKLSQLTGKRYGHGDIFGVLNLHASIADTAKKKADYLVDADRFQIRSTQSKTYRSKKSNEVSSKSFHGFTPITYHRTVRSKRGSEHTFTETKRTSGKHKDNGNVEPLRETSHKFDKKETFDNDATFSQEQTRVRTAQGESKNKNSETVPVGIVSKNADTNRLGVNNTEKTVLNKTDGAKKSEVTNGSVTPAAVGNGTTPKPEKCPNQTDPTELEIITEFR